MHKISYSKAVNGIKSSLEPRLSVPDFVLQSCETKPERGSLGSRLDKISFSAVEYMHITGTVSSALEQV